MTIPALVSAYRDVLALHVFSVIVWMAGMLMLPVIYLRHRDLPVTSEGAESFVTLERQIFKRMVNPAMYAAWGFGILLILTPGAISWNAPWWLIKFATVVMLSWYHGILSIWRRRLRNGRVPSAAVLRLGIAAPLVFAAMIVTMVMIQP
ncbi:MAG TPA: CopD family protein [Acidisoma sp.]|uniref:CopD family protein n=1 Tax=Acidisoma sp. TaxID=1872115 RepID=UPI002B891350|nr:CopD family protein [Acidisoma sp.]HTI00705.1 CopD family protein [Acidisoma sp.]